MTSDRFALVKRRTWLNLCRIRIYVRRFYAFEYVYMFYMQK